MENGRLHGMPCRENVPVIIGWAERLRRSGRKKRKKEKERERIRKRDKENNCPLSRSRSGIQFNSFILLIIAD